MSNAKYVLINTDGFKIDLDKLSNNNLRKFVNEYIKAGAEKEKTIAEHFFSIGWHLGAVFPKSALREKTKQYVVKHLIDGFKS